MPWNLARLCTRPSHREWSSRTSLAAAPLSPVLSIGSRTPGPPLPGTSIGRSASATQDLISDQDMAEIYVLRWRAVGTETYHVPYSAEHGGDWAMQPPFTGTAIPSPDEPVAEYFTDPIPLPSARDSSYLDREVRLDCPVHRQIWLRRQKGPSCATASWRRIKDHRSRPVSGLPTGTSPVRHLPPPEELGFEPAQGTGASNCASMTSRQSGIQASRHIPRRALHGAG